MRNPFRGERSAYRFLLAVAFFAAILALAAAVGAVWAAVLGVLVTLVLLAVDALGHRRTRELRTAPAHVGPRDERRLLVLAQEPVPPDVLPELRASADRLLVVAAPEVGPAHRLVSDTDDARREAQRRVETTVAALRALDADVSGVVGDEDPVRALEDALRTFGGDAIAVAAPPRVVAQVRERYALPVTRLGS
jgi:hypothetical protein